jgi:hypothetical protein
MTASGQLYGLKIDGRLNEQTIDSSREEVVGLIRYGRTWFTGTWDRALDMLEKDGRIEITGKHRTILIEIVPVTVRESGSKNTG